MKFDDAPGLFGFLYRVICEHSAECLIADSDAPRIMHVQLGHGAMADLVRSIPPGALLRGGSSRDGLVRAAGIVYEPMADLDSYYVAMFTGGPDDDAATMPYSFKDVRPFYE